MNRRTRGILALAAFLVTIVTHGEQVMAQQSPTERPPVNSERAAERATAHATEHAAEQIAERIVHQLARGQFDSVVAQFNDAVAGALPATKLAETWRAVLNQAGAFEKSTGTSSTRMQGYQVVIVACAFQKAALD